MMALAALLVAAGGAQAQAVFGNIAVGGTSPPTQQSVTVTAPAGGVVASVEILTLGAPSLDFTAGSGPTCVSANPLSPGGACTQSVTFTPSAPGLRTGAVVLLNYMGDVVGTAYLSGTGWGGLGVLVPGNVVTVAGVYRNWTSTQDGIPATQANLDQPSSLTLDGAGNMYIADSAHNRIRMVAAPVPHATAGIISTIAGTGEAGYTGDGQTAANSTLSVPSGVALDGAGNLYIADTGNNVIRMISPPAGIITTVAGNSAGNVCAENTDAVGDGCPATAAILNSPQGITVDSGGNLYIADTGNQRIRRVDAVTGMITTVAGNGDLSPDGNGMGTFSGDNGLAINAGLSLPYAVVFDASGNMFIPDSANNRIRKVNASGVISTVAGGGNAGSYCDNGPANNTELDTPTSVAVDAAGNLYIADTQDSCIRRIDFAVGTVTAIALNGYTDITSSGGLSSEQIYAPMGLFTDGGGDVYFADYYYMLIEEIQSNKASLNFTMTPVRQGSKSSTQGQVLENDGNAALDLTAFTPDMNAALDDTVTTCAIGTPFLPVDADCTIGAVFAPSVAGDPLLANIDVAGDTVNSPLDIELIGNATLVNSTTTTLTSVPNPSPFGQTVIFTATVTTGPSSGNLTGTVSFFDGTNTLAANVALNALPGTTATATYITDSLTVGVHTITAKYNAQDTADPTHFSSTSKPYLQTVNENTATVLTSSANPSVLDASVALSATVTISGGGGVAPDGTVTFIDGANLLGTATLNPAGVATYTTTTLPQGLNTITATYNGDATLQILSSTSNTVSQDVQASSPTTLTTAPNPSNYGELVTFTVTVTPGGTAPPTGLVNILDGVQQIAEVSLLGSTGQATFQISTLTAGLHQISATYLGDTNNASSTSSTITQTVNKTTPAIAWAAPAAITYGTALSATQLDATSGAVAGNFTYTPPAGAVLTAGTQTLSVTFTPSDTTDYNTTTATVSLIVNMATPTLSVRTSGTPSSYGAAVTFTATISNGPTGLVTFYDGGNVIGSGMLNGPLATFTIGNLSVGSHIITASWPGTSNYYSVTSNSITQAVNPAVPVITWAIPAPITYGTALSATQLDATTTTAGTFTYTPVLGTVLGAGQRTLSVLFTPTDTTDYTTETATVTLTVNKATPVITWAPPAAITYGTALSGVQLNATAGGLAGAFVYTPAAGPVPAAGVQTLSATFIPTDTTDYSSPTATVQLTVNKATPTLAVNTSGSPTNYGAAVTFTATAGNGLTGPVTFYDGSTAIGAGTLNGATATLTVSTLPVGAHAITASWPGNNNFIAVTSNEITQIVNVTQTSTTISLLPNPGIAGTTEAITATVRVIAGVATASGIVTFTDGTAILGSAYLGATGTATIHPELAPGPHLIAASYAGDANDNGSASTPFAFNVVQATTTTSVAVTPNFVLVQGLVTFSATVTGNGGVPTGTVTFSANGTAIGSANLVAGAATLIYSGLAVGSYPITAVYGGDTNDQGSAGTSAVQLVVGSIQTITELGTSTTGGAMPQALLVSTVLNTTGSSTPTGTVTFFNGTTVIGSGPLDASGVATLALNLSSGSYTIVAYYSGDLTHGTSTSSPITVDVPGAGFDLHVTPATVTIQTKQNAMLTVTLASIGGFADTIGLGCASLPVGVTCHFSSISANLTANELPAPTVQLTIDTNNPLTGGSTAMNSHFEPPGATLAGLCLPISLFFGWVVWRFRRRHAMAFTTMLVLLLFGAALFVTGCGEISYTSAQPGTYVIQVTGVGSNSDIAHYQNVTLNITQ